MDVETSYGVARPDYAGVASHQLVFLKPSRAKNTPGLLAEPPGQPLLTEP